MSLDAFRVSKDFTTVGTNTELPLGRSPLRRRSSANAIKIGVAAPMHSSSLTLGGGKN